MFPLSCADDRCPVCLGRGIAEARPVPKWLKQRGTQVSDKDIMLESRRSAKQGVRPCSINIPLARSHPLRDTLTPSGILPPAFRMLGKWDERAKMPMSHATISFHEYLQVIHGARVSALTPCASAVCFELHTRLKHFGGQTRRMCESVCARERARAIARE